MGMTCPPWILIYVARNPVGDEGMVSWDGDLLYATDDARLPQVRAMAGELAKQTAQPIFGRRFTDPRIVETYQRGSQLAPLPPAEPSPRPLRWMRIIGYFDADMDPLWWPPYNVPLFAADYAMHGRLREAVHGAVQRGGFGAVAIEWQHAEDVEVLRPSGLPTVPVHETFVGVLGTKGGTA